MKNILIIILGIIIGIFSKWGDVIPNENIISYFGFISSGIVLWLMIGTILLFISKNRKEFSIMYSLFMTAMLISYYLFSSLIVKYLYVRIIIFWIMMLIVSLIFGNIIFYKRYTKTFKLLFILSSIVFLIYDAIKINGIQFEIIILEIIIIIFTMRIIKKIKSKN